MVRRGKVRNVREGVPEARAGAEGFWAYLRLGTFNAASTREQPRPVQHANRQQTQHIVIWAPDDLQYSGQLSWMTFLTGPRLNAEQSPGSHARLLDHRDHVDDRRRDRCRLSRGPCRSWRTITDCAMAALLIASLLLQLRSRQYV